jgi:hypothetical protein
VTAVAEGISAAVSGRRFERADGANVADAHYIRWIRELAWKHDVVELVHRRGRARVYINLIVDVPLADQRVVIDGTTVEYVRGRSNGYAFPGRFFRTWRVHRLVERIDADVRRSVDWFDRYDTPSRALDRLQSSDRNGCAVGTDVHRRVVDFLKEAKDQHSSRHELMETFAAEAPRIFVQLSDRLGMRFRIADRGLLTLQSEAVRIRIRFGSGHVPDLNVLVDSTPDRPAAYDDVARDIVGMGVVLRSAGAADRYDPAPIRTTADLRREVDKAAGIVERWGPALVAGDLKLPG